MGWITKYLLGSMSGGAVLGLTAAVVAGDPLQLATCALDNAIAAAMLGVVGAVVGPVLPLVVVYRAARL
jgi:hypothetical protein